MDTNIYLDFMNPEELDRFCQIYKYNEHKKQENIIIMCLIIILGNFWQNRMIHLAFNAKEYFENRFTYLILWWRSRFYLNRFLYSFISLYGANFTNQVHCTIMTVFFYPFL